MQCYGHYRSDKEKCGPCELRQYCQAGKDPPLLTDRDCGIPVEELSAGTASPEPDPKRRKTYSREELLEFIGFFVSLDYHTLEMLDAKLSDPDVPFAEIARKRGISRQAVHKYIKQKCEKNPELAPVLENRKRRTERTNHLSFMEEVCRIRRTKPAKCSKRPDGSWRSWNSLTCLSRSLDLSRMSIFKGAASWKSN